MSLGLLYETLQLAASQDAAAVKAAEPKLAEWESQPGYYTALTTILARQDFNANARFIAAIQLKNGIDKHWKRVPNSPHSTVSTVGISVDERQIIKSNLEQLVLVEPATNIALQLALVVAKIARAEVKEWPTLLPMLMSNIQVEDPFRQHRALLCTYHVIKILATKRLTGDRKIFQEMASEIFVYLHQLWERLFLTWANSGASGDDLPRAHYALKILRILCIRGYKVPHETPAIKTFVCGVMQRAKETMELRLSRQDTSILLEKHVVTMWKVVRDMLEVHPLSFVPFLQSGLEFATYFGFSEQGRCVVFEKAAIHALNLLKGIILCAEYRPPRTPEGERRGSISNSFEINPLTYEAADIKSRFFIDETLYTLVRILVTRYLPLTESELEAWSEDPEDFCMRMEESGETWKYNLRQSAETLLVTLFKEFQQCSQIFVPLLKEYEAPVTDPLDRQRILAKDALYNTVGLVSYELYDEFCFDTWLQNTLLHEMSIPIPILHRRITWLIGQWTGVKLSSESRPSVYTLLLGALQSPDIVVRITASQALKHCLDDFEFLPEQFEPYMDEFFKHLFVLLKDVQECDNKMRVLYCMSFLIERMGPQIKGAHQLGSLAQYLPLLWDTNHNMLKGAVILTSIQLVQALGTESRVLREFLFPVIRISTDLNSPEHVYLLEDALELWLTLMDCCSDPPDDSFLTLTDNLLPLLTISTEHLKTSLAIVNSYCLIYPEYFANKFGVLICSELDSSAKDLRAEGMTSILRCVETILRTSPINGPAATKPLLARIFRAVYEACDVQFLMALFISVVARILLVSNDIFQYGIAAVGESEGKPPADVLSKITDVMCEKVKYIVQPERKKLVCIALLKLLSTCEPVILHRVCGIFLAVSETLNDIFKTDGNGKMIDSLCVIYYDNSRDSEEGATENDLRKKRLAAKDVVYTMDLVQLFRNEVSNLRARLGEVNFNDAMCTVDCETMQLAKPFLE